MSSKMQDEILRVLAELLAFWKRVAAVAAWKAAKLSNRLLNTPLHVAWNSPCQAAAEKPKTGGGNARAALPAGVESG